MFALYNNILSFSVETIRKMSYGALFRMADQKRHLSLTTTTVLMILTCLGNGTYAQCFPPNIVVYEGALNTLISCSKGPNDTAWSVRPTSSAFTPSDITNYDDTVAPTLTGLYAINQTGLILRNATTVNDTNRPISTAGVYFVQSFDPANGNRTAFKVVVIRSGPNCSCVELPNGNISISCNIVFADHPSYPIMPMMNCTANGQSYNAAAPTRTLLPSPPLQTQYVWNSTSTVTTKDIGPTTYDCFTTFAAPLTPVPYLAKNAPDFNATTQMSCGSATTASTTTTVRVSRSTAAAVSMTTPPAPLTTVSQQMISAQQVLTASLTTTTQVSHSAAAAVSTTTPAPLTTVSQQTISAQQVLAGREIVLSIEVILPVVLGCLFLTTVVCCFWGCRFFPGFCGGRFQRQPKSADEEDNVREPSDSNSEESVQERTESNSEDSVREMNANGFWGRSYIPRYTVNSFRQSQLGYRNTDTVNSKLVSQPD